MDAEAAVEYDHPLQVHDDHVILTLTPDLSGFRRDSSDEYLDI